jgi:hypothetical protein
MSSPVQNLVLDFFMPTAGTRALPPVKLDVGGDDSDDPPEVQEEVLLFACQFLL